MRQDLPGRLLTYRGIPLWRHVQVQRAFAQIVVVLIVVSVVAFALNNLLDAANRQGIRLGYDFLDVAAGFPIGESVIPYHPSNSFIYAFLVGILNTLKVVLVGVVLATILGVLIGVARVSPNWLLSKMATAYVEIFRNVPLLVQLFFWFFAVFLKLPNVQDSIKLPGPVYLTNRGAFIVSASPTSSFWPWLAFVIAGVLLALLLRYLLTRLRERTGRSTYPLLGPIAVLFIVSALGWLLMDPSPLVREVPVLGRFNYQGGTRLTPEFAALLVGLVIYTASFIAEIVRAGIQSVPRGQVEAARALGLSDLQALRLVIFPQALRVIIPPLISQYLNLTKNSSLAIAIAYPDLFFVSKVMINQSGSAVPIILMLMVAYLTASLSYAAVGNLYSRRVRLVER